MSRWLALVLLCVPAQAWAATVVKTVGATGADYATIALWEDALDDDGVYDPGDTAVCELIDASYASQSVTIDGGDTLGLAAIVIRPAAGNVHDGTFGSGCRLNLAAVTTLFTVATTTPITFQDLEMWSDLSSGNYSFNYFITDGTTTGTTITVQRCLFYCDGGERTTSGYCTAVYFGANGAKTVVVQNCVFKNMTRGSAGAGIATVYGTGAAYTILNNTVVGCYDGINTALTGPTNVLKNNIVHSSVNEDYKNDEYIDTAANNYSEDGTHGTQTSQTLAELFTDPTNGDYTPKAGSDLIDHGADLGTTPTGVNIDAKQRDRDSEGDTWDVGAIESVSGGSSIAPAASYYYNQQ